RQRALLLAHSLSPAECRGLGGSSLGPLRKTTLHVSRGPSTQHSEEATTITFYNFFLNSQFKTLFLLGVWLSVADSKGTFYGGHVSPFYGNRFNLYKAGLNPHHSPNKPMTRH
ncbi:hypothetical protein JOQ06_006943, partial [Pogonophryne albipinna]